MHGEDDRFVDLVEGVDDPAQVVGVVGVGGAMYGRQQIA
jgi:hypothetical protein